MDRYTYKIGGGSVVLKMKAILPAAGYAIRMGDLTLNTPKALLLINKKPVIEYIIEKLSRIPEVDEITIVTNNKFYDNFLEWKKNSGFENVRIINDNTNSNEDRLGTIGDIQFTIDVEKINDDLIIINADNLFSFELINIFNYFKEKNSSIIAVHDVGDLNIAKRMGNPKINQDNKVIDFKEKDQNTTSTLVSGGIYLIPKQHVKKIKEYLELGNSPDKSGEFIIWLHKKEPVYAYKFDNPGDKWFDIGDKAEYKRANEAFS